MSAGLLALGLLSGPLPTALAAQPAHASYLCLIVLDGGRPDYITRNLAAMPHLRALMKRGRSYRQAWVGDLPSMTPVSHAVIGTGAFPKHDGGIVNWRWRDGMSDEVTPTLESQASFRSSWAYRVIKQSGTPTLSGAIRKAYPDGPVIAGSGSHFHAAGPMGGPDASWIFSYDRQHGYWAPYSLGLRPVPAELLKVPSLRAKLVDSTGSTVSTKDDPLPLGRQDSLVMRFAIRALHSYRPRAMMLNLPEPDSVGHVSRKWRSEEATVYRAFDADLGRLVAAYKSANIYDKTLFVVTADHGMIRSKYRVLDTDRVLQIVHAQQNSLLLTNGFGTDTMMALWLHDTTKRWPLARALYRAHMDNVSAIFARSPDGHDYRLAGCEDCSRHLASAYHYLLDTDAEPSAAGVTIMLRENARRIGEPDIPGRHGGADWGSQHIPLIFAGPGVKPGVSEDPARLVDLAPTIERFMGIDPRARDGLVLADAFLRPVGSDINAQRKSDEALLPYVEALQARAQSDISLERTGKLPNPIQRGEERYWVRDHLSPWDVAIVEVIGGVSDAFGRFLLPLCGVIPLLLLVLIARSTEWRTRHLVVDRHSE